VKVVLFHCSVCLHKHMLLYKVSLFKYMYHKLIANYHYFGRHKIVIVEGNYLLLEEDVWREIGDGFDEKW
jgi:uridine kinase